MSSTNTTILHPSGCRGLLKNNHSMSVIVNIRSPPTLDPYSSDITPKIVKGTRPWDEYDPEEALPNLPWTVGSGFVYSVETTSPYISNSPKKEDTGGQWFSVIGRRQRKNMKN